MISGFNFTLRGATMFQILCTAGKCFAGCVLVLTVFGSLADAKDYDVLWTFKGTRQGDGAYPLNGLMMDRAGNLFGTTEEGGAHSSGTIFKLAPDGSETVLYSFKSGNDGATPTSTLIADSAGNLYGTTSLGGTGTCNVGCGTVFKFAPDGTETVLHTFQQNGKDGFYPLAGLVRDRAGNLFGTTYEGGTGSCLGEGCGTVFAILSSGKEKILYRFQGASDGGLPYADALVRDKSGNLYGTTIQGGTSGLGVIFKISHGTETVLHSCLGYPDCSLPYGGLSADKAGNLYGSSAEGGADDDGTVFKVTPDGSFTVLYSFTGGEDGLYPESGVIVDESGNLYGTTAGETPNGCRGCGTVFKIAPDGTETTLHHFEPRAQGRYSHGKLLERDGYLYGTTEVCGHHESLPHCVYGNLPHAGGTVFELKK